MQVEASRSNEIASSYCYSKIQHRKGGNNPWGVAILVRLPLSEKSPRTGRNALCLVREVDKLLTGLLAND